MQNAQYIIVDDVVSVSLSFCIVGIIDLTDTATMVMNGEVHHVHWKWIFLETLSVDNRHAVRVEEVAKCWEYWDMCKR